jgi:hypothetical protein
MKKIRLNLDQLAVESFATERNEEVDQVTVDGGSGVPLAGCVTINDGDCGINPTFGTGHEYCICPDMLAPANTYDGNC